MRPSDWPGVRRSARPRARSRHRGPRPPAPGSRARERAQVRRRGDADDFLVGDRWELFAGPIAALLVAWLATRASVPAPATGALLFVLVAAVGGLSIGWAMRGWPASGRSSPGWSRVSPRAVLGFGSPARRVRTSERGRTRRPCSPMALPSWARWPGRLPMVRRASRPCGAAADACVRQGPRPAHSTRSVHGVGVSCL